MSNNWKSKNRHKFLLQYHLIFVCKYRKKLLSNNIISDDIKQFSCEICNRHNVIIHEMETDKDHIHYMIETEPNINLSNLIRIMKSYTTYHIWKLHNKYLSMWLATAHKKDAISVINTAVVMFYLWFVFILHYILFANKEHKN